MEPTNTGTKKTISPGPGTGFNIEFNRLVLREYW